jgi:Zn-dependent protease
MILFNIISNPILFIGFILGILSAITIHESAHAWTAYKLGDPTAKIEGRISANPFRHLDLFGTMMLLLAGFGWGKPVPININNLKSKYDEIKIAYAGSLSNILLAIIVGIIIRLIPLNLILTQILIIVIQINSILAIFNILPIPPLDGSKILKILLPKESYQVILSLSTPLFIAFLFFIYSSPIFSNFIASSTQILISFLVGK